jgi:phosphate/sulfate permease
MVELGVAVKMAVKISQRAINYKKIYSLWLHVTSAAVSFSTGSNEKNALFIFIISHPLNTPP